MRRRPTATRPPPTSAPTATAAADKARATAATAAAPAASTNQPAAAEQVTPLTQSRGGSGPPLVLIHGLGLTWRCWRPILPALEKHHDVAALDLPGFGAVPPLPDGAQPTPDALADALEQELDSLAMERPALVGNSLGGWLALELARRWRASRVVAIAPAGLELPPERAYVIALNEAMRLRSKLGAPLGRLLTRPRLTRAALLVGLRERPWRGDPHDRLGGPR